jgi:hypothetical protein
MAEKGYVEGEFEVEFIPYLTGTIGAKVWEQDEEPSHILDIHDEWYVRVDWTVTGSLERFLGGTWSVDAYMESIGKGPEFELPDIDGIPMNRAGAYSATITVPGDYVVTHGAETDIVFKLVCTVTYRDPYGQPGPMAGFVDYPMLQFYLAE